MNNFCNLYIFNQCCLFWLFIDQNSKRFNPLTHPQANCIRRKRFWFWGNFDNDYGQTLILDHGRWWWYMMKIKFSCNGSLNLANGGPGEGEGVVPSHFSSEWDFWDCPFFPLRPSSSPYMLSPSLARALFISFSPAFAFSRPRNEDRCDNLGNKSRKYFKDHWGNLEVPRDECLENS